MGQQQIRMLPYKLQSTLVLHSDRRPLLAVRQGYRGPRPSLARGPLWGKHHVTGSWPRRFDLRRHRRLWFCDSWEMQWHKTESLGGKINPSCITTLMVIQAPFPLKRFQGWFGASGWLCSNSLFFHRLSQLVPNWFLGSTNLKVG